jgi:SWI/SNF-related matrix-associated actin-dependent regulator 1 of chromatin subfamily A
MRSWNDENKCWDVPAEDYSAVKCHLAAAGWELPSHLPAPDDDGDGGEDDAAAGPWGDRFRQSASLRVTLVSPQEVERVITTRVPGDMWARLRGYQQTGVKYAVARGGRALLADDMGLGKTLQVSFD